MKLFRYYNREIFQVMFAIMLILLTIMIAISFIKYLALAANGSMPLKNAFAMLGVILPGFFGLLLPISLFLGIVVGMGRLISDNELIIGFASGMSWFAFLYRLLKPVLFFFLLGLLLNFLIIPKMNLYRNNLAQISAQSSGVFDFVQSGRFFSVSDKIVYVERVDFKTHQSHNIFIYEENKAGSSPEKNGIDLLLAPVGTVTENSNHLSHVSLQNGTIYQTQEAALAYRIIHFDSLNLTMIPSYNLSEQDLDSKSTLALWKEGSLESKVELEWRAALPLATLVLTVLGVGLADLTPRRSRYLKLFYAIGLFIIYFNLESILKALVLMHKFPVFPGLFSIHSLFLLFAVLLILVREGYFNFIYKTRGAK